MTDNDRRCVNELYKKIVRKHDPYYCDPETLPMPALCALIKDSVTDRNLALNNYDVKLCEAERAIREMKEKFDKYRLAVQQEDILRLAIQDRILGVINDEELENIIKESDHMPANAEAQESGCMNGVHYFLISKKNSCILLAMLVTQPLNYTPRRTPHVYFLASKRLLRRKRNELL